MYEVYSQFPIAIDWGIELEKGNKAANTEEKFVEHEIVKGKVNLLRGKYVR